MTSNAAQHESLRPMQKHHVGDLSLSSARDGEVHTIRFFGELDLATTAEVEQELRRVEAEEPEEIVLDLSGLEFIDSTGIAFLIAAESRSRAGSHRLTLRRGSPAVQRAVEICGVDAILPFAD